MEQRVERSQVPHPFVRIHYSPYNSGAPFSSPSFGDRVGPDGRSRSDPAGMNRNPGPILSPKEGEKDGAPDLPRMTASLIGKGGPPGRPGSSWNKSELFSKG